MKFTWFHLMPWPHLPDDFREKHRSVWVDIAQQHVSSPSSSHERLSPVLDQLEYAEHGRLRRHRRERAPRQRLRPDAVAQHHAAAT